MSIKIVTEAPLWYTLFCLLAGGVYAALLYFRNARLNEFSRGMLWLLSGFRFVAVSLLCFLLLSPLLKTVSREVEKPVVVIAQDVSESTLLTADSAWYRNEYRQKLSRLTEKLAEKFEVKTYSFGEKFRENIAPEWTDRQTDFSTLFDEIETRFSGRNLGAVIVASDGLYNKGESPVFAASWLKAPVFTVAMGDTTVRRDLLVNNVLHNKIAFLGNTFPLEIVAEAHRCAGMRTVLTVSQNGQTLFSQPLTLTGDPFSTTIPVQLDAKAVGLQRYRVSLTAVDGEQNLRNNTREILVDVLDGRQKVLLVSNGPHPDIGALKQSIETSQNYEAEAFTLDQFTQPVGQYNLAVLHGIPSQSLPGQKLLADLEAANIPVFYITGLQPQYTYFNNLKAGVRITSRGERANECEAVPVNGFPLFSLGDNVLKYIPQFPAVQSPFADFQSSPGATPFLRQKIGALKTDYPLWVFAQQGDRKTAVFAGEGLWKWRLRDFADHGNHDIFNEIVSKTVQYLAVKVDKSLFRLSTRNSWDENQQVSFEAEVYNESYELITEPEVTLSITNAKGKQFPFTFTKTATAYRLTAGQFAPGDYSYTGRVTVNGKVFTQKGSFSVAPLVMEAASLTANHQLLYNLAQSHNGAMINARELDKLEQLLLAREDIRPVIYNPQQLNDLITRWWVFAVLLLLLAAEWFLRKRNGAY
ncbi:MAG: hypothetical protein IM638_17430 [Bacteroidetes bacterium]|nr:hypothetical protein [Bacteroidota bacterium]